MVTGGHTEECGMRSLADDLERVYREDRQALFTCALAVTRSVDRAEDALQEAFCRLFRMEERPRRLRAYVFRAVRNAALDQVRRGPRPAQDLDESVFDPAPGPAAAAEEAEFGRRAAAELLALGDDEREVIVQHLYGGLTFREIAEVRDVPLGTAAAWYRRGLMKLRSRLEECPWIRSRND